MLLTGTADMRAAGNDNGLVTLSIADGLAGETVNRVMTSHDGLVWVATDNGVNAYNGRRLATFRLKDSEHVTVTVRDLCETADHRIVAATDAGLYIMDADRTGFRRVLADEVESPECLLAVGNTLYIGGRQGIQVYDGKQLQQHNVGVSGHGLDNVVRQYVLGDDGFVYFLSRYDLNSYDPRTGRITSYRLSEALNGRKALCQVTMAGGRCFVGTRMDGLYVYDMKLRKAEHIKGVGRLVTSVGRSADGYVTVSTDGSGAYLINPADGSIVEHYNSDGNSSLRLPTNAVYSFLRDANGVNWFGFVRYGVAYTPHNRLLFQPYSFEGFSTLGMNVRTHCMRGNEGVIGTHNGCWYVGSQQGRSHYFAPSDLGGGHIVNCIAWWEGEYYIGTFDGGLWVLNPQSLSLHRLTVALQLSNGSIGDIKVGPDGRLWIGSSDGLFIIDKQGAVKHFTEQNSHIVGGIIISITFDRQRNAWLTGASGISLFSASSGEIADMKWPKGFFNGKPFMRGTAGHDGRIYMRTGPQVYFTNTDMSQWGELPLPVTLSDKWCRSMVDDAQGNLWLASERGLFRFAYDMTGMMQLGNGEGLLGDQISEVSIDGNGRLWVATSAGLFIAYPRELAKWRDDTKFKVRLYDVRRGSDLMGEGEEIRVNDEHAVRLGWNMGSEVLQAVAVLADYALQRGRLYEYRIDEKEWKMVKDGEPLKVSSLWPGRHRLEVRLAGADGTCSVYQLNVVPTALAIFELLLLVVAATLLWLWWRYRKNTRVLLSERNEIEDALIAVEEELNQVENPTLATRLSASPTEKDTTEKTKYQKVKIDEQECEHIVKRMKHYIEQNKVYANAELKMKDLADELGLSSSKLSQVFNLYLNENYYEFINRYRLNEFKRLIEAGEYKRFTITALSEQCGFKKSNFFSTFRKVEGMTPAEYLKKQGVKV